jgi:hypothetical protein
MWYIHTIKYYSAIKNEILIYDTIWIALKISMLNEIRQTQKDKYCGITFFIRDPE